jgi:thioredoxin-dependent peroxiredoxin
VKALSLCLSLCLGLFATAAVAALKPGDAAPDFTMDAAQGGKHFKFFLAEALKKGTRGSLLLSQIIHERLHDRGA